MSVAKQYKNRRENVLINDIPPEILTEAKLSADGFVKNTDYATTSVGGVIKTGGTNNGNILSSGTLIGVTRTAAEYATFNNNGFISKGTLENIKDKLVSGGLAAIADTLSPTAEVGTVFKDLALVKGADGAWMVTFLTITPPTH